MDQTRVGSITPERFEDTFQFTHQIIARDAQGNPVYPDTKICLVKLGPNESWEPEFATGRDFIPGKSVFVTLPTNGEDLETQKATALQQLEEQYAIKKSADFSQDGYCRVRLGEGQGLAIELTPDNTLLISTIKYGQLTDVQKTPAFTPDDLADHIDLFLDGVFLRIDSQNYRPTTVQTITAKSKPEKMPQQETIRRVTTTHEAISAISEKYPWAVNDIQIPEVNEFVQKTFRELKSNQATLASLGFGKYISNFYGVPKSVVHEISLTDAEIYLLAIESYLYLVLCAREAQIDIPLDDTPQQDNSQLRAQTTFDFLEKFRENTNEGIIFLNNWGQRALGSQIIETNGFHEIFSPIREAASQWSCTSQTGTILYGTSKFFDPNFGVNPYLMAIHEYTHLSQKDYPHKVPEFRELLTETVARISTYEVGLMYRDTRTLYNNGFDLDGDMIENIGARNLNVQLDDLFDIARTTGIYYNGERLKPYEVYDALLRSCVTNCIYQSEYNDLKKKPHGRQTKPFIGDIFIAVGKQRFEIEYEACTNQRYKNRNDKWKMKNN